MSIHFQDVYGAFVAIRTGTCPVCGYEVTSDDRVSVAETSTGSVGTCSRSCAAKAER